LIQRIDGDVTNVSDFLGRVLVRFAGAVVLVVGMVVVLAVLDWRLALALAAYVAVAVVVLVRGRERAVAEAADEMGANARLYGGIEERLTAAEDLRSAGAGAHALWRFVEDSAHSLATAVRRERAFLRLWWSVQLAVIGGAVAAIVLGAVLVDAGLVTVGTAFLLFHYSLLLKRPLEEVVDELETIQKASGALARVADLQAERPTVADAGRTRPAPGPLEVRFDGVSFAYGDEEPVLRDVGWCLAAGRSAGVVGRTGSGKTTLSRLVLRLVDATEGTVRLGEVPVSEIPLAELRRRVALIPQEVELFAGTVGDNVTLFDPEVDPAAVEHALRRAGLEALVAGGIDRPLGAGGAGLSAGEAQLLALARVWLRQPDVVVLDEATARVDPGTEARLARAVRELLHGRTALVIAHRLSTLANLDEILVLGDGRVVEHGPRDRLAAEGGGRFARLLDLALESSEPA
jgi:ATP-binding cassette, subfamily B, bacterial